MSAGADVRRLLAGHRRSLDSPRIHAEAHYLPIAIYGDEAASSRRRAERPLTAVTRGPRSSQTNNNRVDFFSPGFYATSNKGFAERGQAKGVGVASTNHLPEVPVINLHLQ